MSSNDAFLINIRKRKDIDPNGVFDVVAHGAYDIIEVEHNGTKLKVDSRTAAQLISHSPGYRKGQNIRLLACNTGSAATGFAQNLANKLNVAVYAPDNYLWVWANGRYKVAGKVESDRNSNNQLEMDPHKPGRFIKYTPAGNLK